MRRVVVTGMGAVTPIGNTVPDAWAAVKAGKCGVDFIRSMDTSEHKIKIGAEVRDLPIDDLLGKKEARKMSRCCQLAMSAAGEA